MCDCTHYAPVPAGYTKRVIEALYEQSDPVSVDAAEELERLFALAQDKPEIDYKAMWEQMCERCDALDKALHELEQKDEQAAPAAVAVQCEALSLSGDAKLAHDQCRAVVHLANSLAEIYTARAAIVAHDAKLADLIGEASASAMEWLGDELDAMDAASEDDEWVDHIFEAAQERWPQPPKRQPLTDAQRYALIEKHLGLEQRKNATVIDHRTGRWTDAARYFDLMDAAIETANGTGEQT